MKMKGMYNNKMWYIQRICSKRAILQCTTLHSLQWSNEKHMNAFYVTFLTVIFCRTTVTAVAYISFHCTFGSVHLVDKEYHSIRLLSLW